MPDRENQTSPRPNGPATTGRRRWPPVFDPAQGGLECLACGCRHFEVIYTRPAPGGRIVRRRACRHCGRRLTTYEAAACSPEPGAGGPRP